MMMMNDDDVVVVVVEVVSRVPDAYEHDEACRRIVVVVEIALNTYCCWKLAD